VRIADLLGFAVAALYQQKVRTLLTTSGVVIGSFVLAASVSLGQGVQEAAMRLYRRHDRLRQIDVYPGYRAREEDIPADELRVSGAMSDAKRERIRQVIIRRWRPKDGDGRKGALTRQRVQKLAEIEHVEAVVPTVQQDGRAVLDGKTQHVFTAAGSPEDKQLGNRIVAGGPFTAADGRSVVVTEYLLYRWGIADEADVDRVLGRKFRLEVRTGRVAPGFVLTLLGAGSSEVKPEEEKLLEKVIQQLPAALEKFDLTPAERDWFQKRLQSLPRRPDTRDEVVIAEEFTIAGVLRCATKEELTTPWGWLGDNADVLLPLKTAEELFFRAPHNRENGFGHVTVTVDREENVKAVTRQVHDQGLHHYSLVEFVDQVRFNVLLISFATAFVAAVALLVAALGITNTMLMSVLERTHEIGVMKAVGARDRHIQLIFLVEGALVGLVGGGLGLLFSWLASFPGDALAKSIIERQVAEKLEESLFAFPLALTLGIPVVAGLVATLAAVYPARRAARVSPITALRHE
jgi:putative ABC transport system permease protein